MPTTNGQENPPSTNHGQSSQQDNSSTATPGEDTRSSQSQNNTSTNGQGPAGDPINLGDHLRDTFEPTEEEKRLWQGGSNNSNSNQG
ncbi:hypothetical protein AG0111_0g12089 [Alternaria gaisen]|uniref:Uncharacterized protein n=1 Tax=Alternaria gaisen TaxID=167740 RepID=A0ACB6F5H3_9PLEO|nr:hypothetical protein AG0111_0g12089 [Alternaria gaisen]